MTKISFSARHFILARHSDKFHVVHREECTLLKLRVEIVFAEESCQLGAIYKNTGTVCFHIIIMQQFMWICCQYKWQQSTLYMNVSL